MTTRYSTSRQKACRQCADAKAKCDRNPARCSRCGQRGLACSYVVHRASELTAGHDDTVVSAMSAPFTPNTPTTNSSVGQVNSSPEPSFPRLNSRASGPNHLHTLPCDLQYRQRGASDEHNRINTERAGSNPGDDGSITFSSLDLLCPIPAEDIRNRWLNPYVPLPGQSIKSYPPNVSAFIFRALKSYAAVAIRGHTAPPFVHHLHLRADISGDPLSTCLSLVRVCHQPLPGSEAAATSIIKQEMTRIFQQIGSYNDLSMLFAFQAYLIYSLVLFFQLNHGADPFLREAMMNLQELACSCSRQGLVCASEQLRTRPRWEAWTVAEAKRRTLFTMYLFDSVLATRDGLPTFIGTELRGLPAPAGRLLWKPDSQRAWEAEYNIYLAEWPTSSLQIEELWPLPQEMDLVGLGKQRQRVDHWLEDADEFGMMLYAVTSCTHGG